MRCVCKMARDVASVIVEMAVAARREDEEAEEGRRRARMRAELERTRMRVNLYVVQYMKRDGAEFFYDDKIDIDFASDGEGGITLKMARTEEVRCTPAQLPLFLRPVIQRIRFGLYAVREFRRERIYITLTRGERTAKGRWSYARRQPVMRRGILAPSEGATEFDWVALERDLMETFEFALALRLAV